MYYVNAKARKLLYRAQFVSYKQFLHSVGWLQRSPFKKKNLLNSLHRRAAKLILSDLSIPTDDKLKTRKLLPLTNN